MGLRDAPDDGETEPGTVRLGGVASLEDEFAVLGRDSRPVVGDEEPAVARADDDRLAAVFRGVPEQVLEERAESPVVREDAAVGLHP